MGGLNLELNFRSFSLSIVACCCALGGINVLTKKSCRAPAIQMTGRTLVEMKSRRSMKVRVVVGGGRGTGRGGGRVKEGVGMGREGAR